jgi:hypothetical protein
VRGDKRLEPQCRGLNEAHCVGSVSWLSARERLNMSFSAA